jgi:hypothetical protein
MSNGYFAILVYKSPSFDPYRGHQLKKTVLQVLLSTVEPS